ncbi:hypothetical protein [Photobacterium sp. TY1-4]|uniref:hypothetical protein n=1 Tax=Photobacterium sp. TY1-4 TaxID=2899122 RepID=UPI0021BFEA9D|nr:hypothetical protein [Photobacterium sp. TY1-4]UXI01434.1 hypothetical protein NH461_00755 [Photobacterium sp. TY1-4]
MGSSPSFQKVAIDVSKEMRDTYTKEGDAEFIELQKKYFKHPEENQIILEGGSCDVQSVEGSPTFNIMNTVQGLAKALIMEKDRYKFDLTNVTINASSKQNYEALLKEKGGEDPLLFSPEGSIALACFSSIQDTIDAVSGEDKEGTTSSRSSFSTIGIGVRLLVVANSEIREITEDEAAKKGRIRVIYIQYQLVWSPDLFLDDTLIGELYLNEEAVIKNLESVNQLERKALDLQLDGKINEAQVLIDACAGWTERSQQKLEQIKELLKHFKQTEVVS